MALIELANADDKDLLDDDTEAQIHGELRIARDIETLGLTRSYKGTDVESLAKSLGCEIEWHDGFELSIELMAMHPDYRGMDYINLGLQNCEEWSINTKNNRRCCIHWKV